MIIKDVKMCVLPDHPASCFTMWLKINGPALHPRPFSFPQLTHRGSVSQLLSDWHITGKSFITPASLHGYKVSIRHRGGIKHGSSQRVAQLSFYLAASFMWFTTAAVWPKGLNGTRPLMVVQPDLPAPRRPTTLEQDANRATKMQVGCHDLFFRFRHTFCLTYGFVTKTAEKVTGVHPQWGKKRSPINKELRSDVVSAAQELLHYICLYIDVFL